MIEAIFNILIFIVFKIVSIILIPIDAIINAALPELSNALSYVPQYLGYVGTYISWILNALMMPSFALTLIIAFYTFKLTVPIQVWIVKLALKWYKALKG